MFKDLVFADDINGLRCYPNCVQNKFIEKNVLGVQLKLHEWGKKNRVTFDASKESYHILDKSNPSSDSFRFLGINFDVKLKMASAIFECVSICNSKMQAFLRAKKYYSDGDVLRLFKAHILSFIEYRTMAIAHASPILLEAVDDILTRLLVRL